MIAIDSSPLIHLSKIGKLDILEGYSIITTPSVQEEVIIRGKPGTSNLINFFERVEIVVVETEKASSIAEMEGVHRADAELLLLAKNKNCTLLTNDKALVLLARSWGIKVWWVTTLILNQVKTGRLSKEEGKVILDELIHSGMKIETKVYIRVVREIDS